MIIIIIAINTEEYNFGEDIMLEFEYKYFMDC